MKRFFILLILGFLVQSCARVGSPIGGSRDTLAPKYLSSNIDSSRINVSRDIKQLRIDFDEYITLKDVQKNLIISPPIKNITRILPTTIPNKFLLIQWSDTLQANTTYNFNFGNSISDNNENNVLKYYNFAFSTGDKIDDLYISGEVKDLLSTKYSSTNKLVVGLYQVKDTINYKQKPYYITKVDDDGYYELNYLSPGKYKIVAFEDENENSVFDSGKEKIGFKKEIVEVEKSISGLNINVYPSKKAQKYKEMQEAVEGILMLFEGNPESVTVKSLNEKLQDIKVKHKPKSDSVMIWFDPVKNEVGQKIAEKLQFSYDTPFKKDTVSVFYKHNSKGAMEINSDNGGGLLPPKSEFRILSNYDLDKIEADKWTLKSDSLTTHNFTAKISPTNPKQILITSDEFTSGKSYQLTIPKETVSSFYNKNPQSKRFDFEVDKIENFGSLTFDLTNAPAFNYWIQLVDGSDKVVYQKYTKGDKVIFDVVKPGEYIVKILVDENGNNYWDEADFEKEIFAEESYLYHKKAIVRPLWESKEEWDLKDGKVFDRSKIGIKPKQTIVESRNDFMDAAQKNEQMLR